MYFYKTKYRRHTLTEKIQTMDKQTKPSNKASGMDISYMFSKITFPKNVEIDSRVFNICNTIAIDCQSTKFSWEYKPDNKQHNVIMNGVQFVSLSKKDLIETRFIDGAINDENQLLKNKINALKNSKELNEFLKDHKRKYADYNIYWDGRWYNNIGYEYYAPSDYDVVKVLDPELYDLMNKNDTSNANFNYANRYLDYTNCYIEQQVFNFIWPEGCVLEKSDFNADDALLLARKAKLNVSDEIYIKDGIKWIGGDSFSSSTKLPHNCFFNVTIPDSVIY